MFYLILESDAIFSCNSYYNFTLASDIVIIIDDSQSFGIKNFNKSKSIFKDLLKVHNLGDAGTHVAVITFAGKASTKLDFIGVPEPSWCELCHEGGRWERDVKYTRMTGETGLRDAMEKAHNILFKPGHRTHAKKRIWLATDFHDFQKQNSPGDSLDPDLEPAFRILKNNDIELFGVGLGHYLESGPFKLYVKYVNKMTSVDCHYREGDDWLNIDPVYHFRPDKDDLIDIKDPETLMCGCDPCKCRVYDDQALYDDHGHICDESSDVHDSTTDESPTPDDNDEPPTPDEKLLIAIVGGVGGVLLLLIIVIVIVCVVKRCRRTESVNSGTSTMEDGFNSSAGQGQRNGSVVEGSNENSIERSPPPTPPQSLHDVIRDVIILSSSSTHTYMSMDGVAGAIARPTTRDNTTQTTFREKIKRFSTRVSHRFVRRTSNKGTCTQACSEA